MNEIEQKAVLKVKGMSCSNCERHIEEDLSEKQGVYRVKASFNKETAVVYYDEEKITIDEIIETIAEAGYTATLKEETEGIDYTRLNKILLGTIFAFVGYVIIRRTGLLNLINLFPQADENTGLGMLFVIGFFTSFHCLAMCGGINLSQCMRQGEETQNKWSTLRPSFLYNLGRVVSYTVIGGLVGALGSVVSFTGRMQGVVQGLAGVFMIIMGINMLGLFPWLRKFNPRMPKSFGKFVSSKKRSNRPFIVGLANGLMPCGPLQAMQLYALAAGSMLRGALAMFLFSLGTVPLMFLFGAFSSILSKKSAGKILKFGAALVVVLGISMLNNGLNLAGIATPYGTNSAEAVQAQMKDGVQEVTTQLQSGSYAPIIVEKGTKVRWTIEAEQGSINGCNNKVIAREYGIEQKLSVGENVIEFTPTEVGTYAYSCWMGMIRSKIYVVEPGDTSSLEDLEEAERQSNIVDYEIPTDKVAVATIEDGIQTVRIGIKNGRFTPAIVVLQEGIETEWIIDVKELDETNQSIQFPLYNAVLTMQEGENTVSVIPIIDFEFAVDDYKYAGYVKVVSDLSSIDLEEIKEEVKAVELVNDPTNADFGGMSCH